MVGPLRFFKEVIFLISQASEELKITGKNLQGKAAFPASILRR